MSQVNQDEIVAFFRSPAIAGIEMMDAEHSSRPWSIYNTTYALAVPGTWCGEARARHRTEVIPPGFVFCTEPGDLHTTTHIYAAGSFQVLSIVPSAFSHYLQERGLNAEPHWRPLAHRMSTPLRTRIRSLLHSLRHPSTSMRTQTLAVQLVGGLVSELLEQAPAREVRDGGRLKADAIRECLTYEDGPGLDLEELARRTGLSRFQVLRVFKKHYGVPPHVYQNCVRVGRATELLRHGRSPAEVAVELGFADQSHLTRLFRRAFGVTPGRYVRTARGRL